MAVNYVKHQTISIKNHHELNEKWVQDIIAKEPSILGLGNLILRDRERIQPRAGRLDILLQDENNDIRFEVEIQLGKVDESHIIRTIEYWDIERKRYPQYEHCAVIIAEDITSRFLNIISLFNGSIPLIAIQMNAIKIGDSVSLIFTKVLDRLIVDDDEVLVVTDRNYWEQRGTKQTVAMADAILELVKTVSLKSNFELKYNQQYIGLAKDGLVNNFISFIPRKDRLQIGLRIPRSDEIEKKIEGLGIDYDLRHNRCTIIIKKDELEKEKEKIIELIKIAYDNLK
jgi:hypothetical protein